MSTDSFLLRSKIFTLTEKERNNYILGTLKEGDYLIQAGAYSLQRTDIPTALLLIERAYDEGKKVNFIIGLIVVKMQLI